MNILNLKKGKSWIITLILFVLVITPIAVNAQEIGTRQHLAAPKITFDQYVVDSGDHINVTVTFADTLAREIPFEVEATNGADILVKTIDDISFVSNKVEMPISSVEMNKNSTKMQLLTGTCINGKTSTFTFKVAAPVDAESFHIILTTDSERYKTVQSKAVQVTLGVTVEVPDIVSNAKAFSVYGQATYKGEQPPEGSYMFMEMISKIPENESLKHIQLVADIIDKTYEFESIKLPYDTQEGEYIIKIYLFDKDRMRVLGYAEKVVTFVKNQKPAVSQVSIYAPQRDVYVTLDNPEVGEGVTYKGLLVSPESGWTIVNDIRGNHNIKAKIVLTYTEKIRDARFVVVTNFGEQEFPAVRSGKSFTGDLRPLKMSVDVTVGDITRRPYINFVYTAQDGSMQEVYIGDLEVVLGLNGYIYDVDTEEKIDGAIVSLYQLNEETEELVEWVDPSGSQNQQQVTAENGLFAWDLANGLYEVRVFHPDYCEADEYYTTLFDTEYGLVEIPELSNVNIGLQRLVK